MEGSSQPLPSGGPGGVEEGFLEVFLLGPPPSVPGATVEGLQAAVARKLAAAPELIWQHAPLTLETVNLGSPSPALSARGAARCSVSSASQGKAHAVLAASGPDPRVRASRPYLHAYHRFGDATEEEWLIVSWLLELTSALPGWSAHVTDVDGAFLAIEAADFLPPWFTPEVAEGRLYIHGGGLHFIPYKAGPRTDPAAVLASATAATATGTGTGAPSSSQPSGLPLEAGADWVATHAAHTIATPAVQACIARRLSTARNWRRTLLHTAAATLPARAAAVLALWPQGVAAAVAAVYERDPTDVIRGSRLRFFHPSLPLGHGWCKERAEGAEVSGSHSGASTPAALPPLVSAAVPMTRVQFAQLAGQVIHPPKAYLPWWPAPAPAPGAAPAPPTPHEVGLKLALGLEMVLTANPKVAAAVDAAVASAAGAVASASPPPPSGDGWMCVRPDAKPSHALADVLVSLVAPRWPDSSSSSSSSSSRIHSLPPFGSLVPAASTAASPVAWSSSLPWTWPPRPVPVDSPDWVLDPEKLVREFDAAVGAVNGAAAASSGGGGGAGAAATAATASTGGEPSPDDPDVAKLKELVAATAAFFAKEAGYEGAEGPDDDDDEEEDDDDEEGGSDDDDDDEGLDAEDVKALQGLLAGLKGLSGGSGTVSGGGKEGREGEDDPLYPSSFAGDDVDVQSHLLSQLAQSVAAAGGLAGPASSFAAAAGVRELPAAWWAGASDDADAAPGAGEDCDEDEDED